MDKVKLIALGLDLNGRIVYANPYLLNLTGYTAEEVQDRDWIEVFIPERFRSEVATLFRALFSQEDDPRLLYSENAIVTKGGEERCIAWNNTVQRDNMGMPEGTMSIGEDITARRQAEAAIAERNRLIEENERLFREIADTVPARIGMTDAQGRLTYSTAQSEAFYGIPSKELLGLIAPPGVHPDDLEFVLKAWSEASQRRSPIDLEYRQRRADGQWRWISSRAVPRFGGDGAFLGFIGVMVDVTERRNAEAALVEAKHAAEEANRAKDEFIAALSHELRTPLTPVLMTAAALESDESLDPLLHEQISLIRHNVDLEARLIDDLLDVTRITCGKFSLRPEKTDIHEVLAKAVETVSEEISRKNITIHIETNAPCATMEADPARLQQVFWNLLKNAVKFTPSGGRITIRTTNPELHRLSVEVCDNGVGIAPESLDKIFAPFEQVAVGDHRFGGLGLGLTIAKTIVELHQGVITAASDGLNSGATFTVQLPVKEVGQIPSRQPGTEPRKPISPLHILLVEDNDATRSVLERLLTRDGHHVQSVATCTAAREAAHQQSATDPFQVLISDLGLPDGSGLKLVQEIKAQVPRVTAIAISGYGTEQDIQDSLQAGFSSHLTKPVTIEEIRHTLVA